METFDCIIVGTGPAGMGAAFSLIERHPESRILMMDKTPYSTGGMRNDCKMNFTFPIGFPLEYWDEDVADAYLDGRGDEVPQTGHSSKVEHRDIPGQGDETGLLPARNQADPPRHGRRACPYQGAPGKAPAGRSRPRPRRDHLQEVMQKLDVPYVDNIVDVGIRLETRIEHYPIVKDYYDPKFYFKEKVRTFCTNSGNAHVVREKYATARGDIWYSVNGHAFAADEKRNNGLVNFALLKTVRLTEPLASGQEFAEHLGMIAALMGGGRPLMQRVGDFRLGRRSKEATFNGDLYDFRPSLQGASPSDISLAMPSKILRYIWSAMKNLDTIVPGILHPSTIMYYPEIKLYANKPQYRDEHFQVAEGVFFAGDGAGTSRGITGAWASGIRASRGMEEYI